MNRPSLLRRIRAAASALRTRSRSFVAPGLLRTPLVVLIVVLALGACSSSGSAKAKTKAKPSTTTTTAPPPVAPLTGLPDPSGAAQSRPVVSIKIDNDSSLARPQTGIDQADIVWDEVVEGEATRFLAMFQSQAPEVVGPVRSVRLTDPLIVWPVGGVFAFSGGAKYAIDGITQAPVTLVDESRAGSAMFRDSARSAPHNLYARPPQLFTVGGVPAPPPPLFDYVRTVSTQGIAVAGVTIGFSNREFAPTYTWDGGTGTWLRSTAAGPFVAKSGAQIAPKNVVVLPVAYAGGVGRIGAEAQLVGEGPVQIFTNGAVINGTWSRSDKAQRITFVDPNGKPIKLTPGPTWVELPDPSYPITVLPAPASTPPNK
ncbi:MAG: DUF3048 domain-containing protein [Acidimicrobiia bacterium]|nr:DUF3048 domain-containing protein [Acidimicrobiia bacterium]